MSPSKVSSIQWDEFSNVVDGKPRGSKEKHQGTSALSPVHQEI